MAQSEQKRIPITSSESMALRTQPPQGKRGQERTYTPRELNRLSSYAHVLGQHVLWAQRFAEAEELALEGEPARASRQRTTIGSGEQPVAFTITPTVVTVLQRMAKNFEAEFAESAHMLAAAHSLQQAAAKDRFIREQAAVLKPEAVVAQAEALVQKQQLPPAAGVLHAAESILRTAAVKRASKEQKKQTNQAKELKALGALWEKQPSVSSDGTLSARQTDRLRAYLLLQNRILTAETELRQIDRLNLEQAEPSELITYTNGQRYLFTVTPETIATWQALALRFEDEFATDPLLQQVASRYQNLLADEFLEQAKAALPKQEEILAVVEEHYNAHFHPPLDLKRDPARAVAAAEELLRENNAERASEVYELSELWKRDY